MPKISQTQKKTKKNSRFLNIQTSQEIKVQKAKKKETFVNNSPIAGILKEQENKRNSTYFVI